MLPPLTSMQSTIANSNLVQMVLLNLKRPENGTLKVEKDTTSREMDPQFAHSLQVHSAVLRQWAHIKL
jgi:hypothetical protein